MYEKVKEETKKTGFGLYIDDDADLESIESHTAVEMDEESGEPVWTQMVYGNGSGSWYLEVEESSQNWNPAKHTTNLRTIDDLFKIIQRLIIYITAFCEWEWNVIW